jgi:glutamate synthase (NADPH/NADH) large chain
LILKKAKDEVKEPLINAKPYREWLHDNRLIFRKIKQSRSDPILSLEELTQRMRAFGYTSETLEFMLLIHD